MKFSLVFALALLSVALLPQCMQVSDGIEVDVAYRPEATPAQIRTDMGYGVRLERALIAVGKVELIACDDVALDLWQLIGPARARAHLAASPTSLGVPFVIDLMQSTGAPLFAGTIQPPPGRYCGIRVLAMPADQDAEGLTEQNLDMLRNSVLVAGRVEDLSTGDEVPLLAHIWEVLQYEMQFDQPLVFEGPVVDGVTIEIDHRQWFDGIDFASQDSLGVQEQITRNVRASLQAIVSQTDTGV